MDEFLVDTEGHCFLCLSIIGSTSDKIGTELVNCSLEQLRRFLRMDLRKVFDEEGSVSPGLLAKVEQAKLKVELCEGCAYLNQAFSKLYKKLEKIEMEITSCAGLIHSKLSEGKESGQILKLRKDNIDDELRPTNKFKGKLEIVEVIRNEAMDKCFKIIRTAANRPAVRIQRQIIKPLSGRRLRTSRNCQKNMIKPISEGHPHPPNQNQSGNVKLETSNLLEDDKASNGSWQFKDFSLDEDFQTNSDFEIYSTVDVKIEADRDEIGNDRFEKAAAEIRVGAKSRQLGLPKWRFNSITRRFTCSICQLELGSLPGISYHYKSIHQNEKYRCKICGSEFSRRNNYLRHHKSKHMLVRYNCNECNKTFSQPYDLQIHIKAAHQGQRLPCRFCSKTFLTYSSRFIHMKRKHVQERNSDDHVE